MFRLEGLDHVALAVENVERAAEWYAEILGLERRYEGMWGGVPVFIGAGNTALALFPRDGKEKVGSQPGIAERGSNMLHLAFRANWENFVAAQRSLKERGIAFDFHDHEISQSIYFRDLDQNRIEITTYEAGGEKPK